MKQFEFYVNKFSSLGEDFDVNFIAPILRRRLSSLDKASLTVLNNVFTDNAENIVFSSQFGQMDRLIKIISQYKEDNEVSPNVFSGSVHNYSVGFFLFNKKKTIPYTALSSGKNTISESLLAAVISKYNNNILCYADSVDNVTNAFALNLSKSGDGEKYILKLQNNDVTDNFEDFVKLFKGEIDTLMSQNYTIERAKQ